MSRAAASAIIRGLLRSGPQSRRFWKCRLCVSLGSSALIPAHRQSPPPRPRKAVRSLALATATLTVSRGSSRALISSRAWLGSCPCCSGVSKSRPACRLVLFGSALSVCSFRAMLSNKEQVAVYTQGRRSWPRDSPSASSRFFPRPLDVHTIVPVIRGAGRAHAHKLGCSGEETAKPRALGQRALVPRPLFQAAEQKHPR